MRKNIINRGPAADPSDRPDQSDTTAASADPAAGLPAVALAKAGRIKVRACFHLAEEIDGEIRRFKPGDTFEIDEARATALAELVEPI